MNDFNNPYRPCGDEIPRRPEIPDGGIPITIRDLTNRPELEISARVRVAIKILELFNLRTRPAIATNDVGFEVVEAKELDLEETKLMRDACHYLSSYMLGNDVPNAVERAALEAMENKSQRESCKKMSWADCPSCKNLPMLKPLCTMCNQHGQVLIESVR